MQSDQTRLLFSFDPELISSFQKVLGHAIDLLEKFDEREKQLRKELENNKLMNEAEACEYLRRDNDTLRYYRTLGLPYFKKGKDVWYAKSDIDTWLASGKVNRHRRP